MNTVKDLPRYIYAADIYCEQCGEDLMATLPPTKNRHDSAEWPQLDDSVSDESDSPQHCGSGAKCHNAIDLGEDGKVGMFFENDLTDMGLNYLEELFQQRQRLSKVEQIWHEYYWPLYGHLMAEPKDTWLHYDVPTFADTPDQIAMLVAVAEGGDAVIQAAALDAFLDKDYPKAAAEQRIARLVGFDIKRFVSGYKTCAVWASTTGDDDKPFDTLGFDADDFTEEADLEAIIECVRFVSWAGDLLVSENHNSVRVQDDGMAAVWAGHDFWLTRNGHGAGFWDGEWNEGEDFLINLSKRFGEMRVEVMVDELYFQKG